LLLSLVARRTCRGLPGEGRELAQERDGVMAEPLAVLPNRRVQFLALPEAIRAGILAMVWAAAGQRVDTSTPSMSTERP
jgi:hypothetical protein